VEIKKALLVHLFMRSFVPAICPGSKHQFSAQIKGEDSFFIVSCWFLSNNLFITEEEWKRKKIKTEKKDKFRRKR